MNKPSIVKLWQVLIFLSWFPLKMCEYKDNVVTSNIVIVLNYFKRSISFKTKLKICFRTVQKGICYASSVFVSFKLIFGQSFQHIYNSVKDGVYLLYQVHIFRIHFCLGFDFSQRVFYIEHDINLFYCFTFLRNWTFLLYLLI